MNTKLLRSIGAVLALGAAGAANAASVSDLLFYNEDNLFSDNDAEYLINADGSLCSQSVAGSCVLDVGDRIRAIGQIETIEDLTGGSGSTNNLGTGGNNELTFISDLTIQSKTELVAGSGIFGYVLAPTASFATELAGYTNVTNTAAELAGTGVAFFEDTTPDFERTDDGTGTRAARIAALEATATDGTLVLTTGLADLDDIFYFEAGNDLIPCLTSATTSGCGDSIVRNSFLINDIFTDWDQVAGNQLAAVGLLIPARPPLPGDGLVDLSAKLDLLGVQGVLTPFDFFTNFDGTIHPNAVPVPGLLGLFGIGLVAMGFSLRRRSLAA